MTSSAEIAARRQTVGELWLRGVPTERIASQLKKPVRTIRGDIASVRLSLEADRIDSLQARRDRSIAVLHRVQQNAWTLYARLDDASSSKIGALNTIKDCEEKIARLEGTWQPDVHTTTTVNLLADPDWIATRSALMAALAPFVEARVAVSAALSQLEAGAGGESNGTGSLAH